jgi:cleavage and polyadenylation specificity factor subunit 4
MTANPLAAPSPLRDIVRPQFHQLQLEPEAFVKNELGIKLDKGA